MKTPWSSLLEYGIFAATIIVLAISGIIMFSIIGIIVALSKISVFIK